MNCPSLYVSQGYGDTPWEHPHAGIDIVCPPATMVVAVATGVFHRGQGAPIACPYPPGRTGGLGTYGVLTPVAGHISTAISRRSRRPTALSVVVGQPLGFEGVTGCATGYHLHFEVLDARQTGRPLSAASCWISRSTRSDRASLLGLRAAVICRVYYPPPFALC